MRSSHRLVGALIVAGAALLAIPFLRLPAFYESFLYLVFHWIVPRHVVEHSLGLFRLFLLRTRRVFGWASIRRRC
jgi:hypothetical protein